MSSLTNTLNKWILTGAVLAGLSACGGGTTDQTDFSAITARKPDAPNYGVPQSPEQQAVMAKKLGVYFGEKRAASAEGSMGVPTPQKSAKAASLSPKAVYRFFNTLTGVHFYTMSEEERASVQANLKSFLYEGPAFFALPSAVDALSPVYRFYNKVSGTHFYTISLEEKNHVAATWPEIFNYEGISWLGSTSSGPGWRPIYRFFNTQTGTHFYSANPAEKDRVIATLPQFSYEGIGYYIRLTDSMDTTLTGVDANQNGVRDSVETVLAKLITEPTALAANLRVAAAYEAIVSQNPPQDRAAALVTMSKLVCAERDAGPNLFESNDYGMLGVMFDTEIRANQWALFTRKLEGGFLGSELNACGFAKNKSSQVKVGEMPGTGYSPTRSNNVRVLFINGISNTSLKAVASSESLALALEYMPDSTFDYDFFYNPTDGYVPVIGVGSLDFSELTIQKKFSKDAALNVGAAMSNVELATRINEDPLYKSAYYVSLGYRYSEAFVDPKYEKLVDYQRVLVTTISLVNNIKSMLMDQKIDRLVIVPHSQGNYYLEAALGVISKEILTREWIGLSEQKFKDKIRVFGVAPVSTTTWNDTGSDYMRHTWDLSVNLHEGTRADGWPSIQSNMAGCLSSPCLSGSEINEVGSKILDFWMHGFTETYLSNLVFDKWTSISFREHLKGKVRRLMDVPAARFGLVGNYSQEECVRDRSTGLVWEGKPASGPRAASDRYTNYDDTTKAQKRRSGLQNVNPLQADIDAKGNSMNYVQYVNGIGLCGFSNWRRPTKNELFALTSATSSDLRTYPLWFTNGEPGRLHITSDPYVYLGVYLGEITEQFDSYWCVYLDDVFERSANCSRGDPHSIRLVRNVE